MPGRETGDEYATDKRFIYRRNQVALNEFFGNVAKPPCSETIRQNLGVLIDCEEYDSGPIRALSQRSGDFQPVHTRHRDIQDDQIRFEVQGCFQSGLSVGDQTNDIECPSQHCFYQFHIDSFGDNPVSPLLRVALQEGREEGDEEGSPGAGRYARRRPAGPGVNAGH